MRFSSLVPLLAAIAAPSLLFAEEQPSNPPAPAVVGSQAVAEPKDKDEDKPLVVTADRHEQTLARTIASTDVVTAADVRERGYQPFVHDWLRGLPGVDVNETAGGMANITQVRLRGAKGGETRFMRDGIPVTDASSTDNSPIVELFDQSGIQQVEVVRGSQSGLYGPNANGGVVNLIGIRPTAKPQAGFQIDAGSHATIAGSARVTGPITDHTGFAINVGGISSEGFSTATDADAKGDPLNHEKDGLQRLGAGARLEARNDRGLIYISGNLVDAEQEFDNDYLSVAPYTLNADDPAAKQELSSWRIAGGGEWRAMDNLTITGDAARTLTKRSYPNEQLYTKDFDAEDTYAGLRTNARLPLDFSAAVGVDGNWQHAELQGASGTTQIDRGARLIGVWATVAYDLPWLSLSATGRHDEHSEEGGADTYRLGAATFWFDQQYKVFGSVGSGFRAPTLYELYAPGSGNPDLKAQTSLSADLGQTIALSGTGLSLTNTWFMTSYKDAIGSGPGPIYPSINIDSDTSIRGLENALSWTQERLSLDAVYTYQHSDDGAGQRLQQLPDHKLNLAGTVRAYQAWLQVAVERQWSRYYGGQDLDAYTLLSASIGWEFVRGWEVYARAVNLTDEDYEIASGYATARRAAYGGIAARF